MSVGPQIALIFLSVGLLFAVMAAVRHFGRVYGWSAELQRKSVHVATGAYALSLPWLFTDRWPVLVITGAAALVLLALRLPALAGGGLGSTLHGVERRSYGDILFAVSVGIVFYFAHETPVFYVLPIAVVTLSDAAAALTGVRYGRKFFNVEAGAKSLEGSAMFFMVTWIVAMILLLLMTDIARENVVLVSLVVAAFCTLMEADSWHGFDNLFLPLGLYLFLWRHIDTPPLSLLGLTLLFLVILAFILSVAPQFGLSRHAARAYTIAIFVICAAAELQNAVLPIVAILAHLAARHVRPSRSQYQDLDVLAVILAVGIFWLFVGTYFDRNALNMYNLSLAGVILVFVVLATEKRIFPGLGTAIVLFAVSEAISLRNPAAQWHGLLWPWVVAGLVPCLLVPRLWPGFFDRYRGPRVAAVALPVPVVFFIVKAFAP